MSTTKRIINLHPATELICSDSWFLYLLERRDQVGRVYTKEGQTSCSSSEKDENGFAIASKDRWVQNLVSSKQSIFSQDISYKGAGGKTIFEVVHALRQYGSEKVLAVVHFSRSQMASVLKAHGIKKQNLDDTFRTLQNAHGFYSNHSGTGDREEVLGVDESNIDELLTCIKGIYQTLTGAKTAGKEEFKLKFLQQEIADTINMQLSMHHRCLIQAAGGFGKSTMSLRIACSDLVMSEPGCTLVLTPVKATASDFQDNAKKFQYFGREAKVVLLKDIEKEKIFFDLLASCASTNTMLVAIATVQDIRGTMKCGVDDEDAPEANTGTPKLDSKYQFLAGNVRLLIRDEIHLQYAAEQTYNALSSLKSRNTLVVDMTATLTAREAILFGYNDSTIASCSMIRVLEAKRGGIVDVMGLPNISLMAATSMKLPRELLDELGVTSEAELTSSKLFAIENGKFKFTNAVMKMLERTFSLGQKFGAMEGTKAAWGPALCGKEPLSTGVYMLVAPRGDASFSASQKCRLIVSLGAAYDDDAIFVAAEDLENNAATNSRSLGASIQAMRIKHPGRKIIVVSHRKLLVGVNIPQLEGIALWDSIESQALFLQLWYRLFREYSGKKSVRMIVYEPGVSIGDTSVAHAIGQLLIDELQDLSDEDRKRKLRELEGLISLQMYTGAAQQDISTIDLYAAYADSYAKAMAVQFGGTVRIDTIRSILGDSYHDMLGLIHPIQGTKNNSAVKTTITEENGGKTNTPMSGPPQDKKERPTHNDEAIETLQSFLQQLPWLAYEAGEYELGKLLVHPFVHSLFRGTGSAVAEMIKVSAVLSEFLVNRLKFTKVDPTASVKIGRGGSEIVLDGGIVHMLLNKTPKHGQRVLLVNPKRFLLEEARKKWPRSELVILTYDTDPYITAFIQEGLTVISVHGRCLNGKIDSMKNNFNIIVGNPPYQNVGKDGTLWEAFIIRGCEYLDSAGYMALITPPGWCNMKDGSALLKSENIEYAELNTSKLKHYFNGVGSEFSILAINRSASYRGCTVICDDGTINVDYRELGFIPMTGDQRFYALIGEYKKLIAKYGSQPIEWGCGRGRPKTVQPNSLSWDHKPFNKARFIDRATSDYFSSPPSSEHIYPFIRTSAKYNAGLFGWAKVPGLAQFMKKVVFTDAKNSIAFFDDGKYSVGDHARAILVASYEEAEVVMSFLNSEVISKLGTLVPASGSWGGIAAVVLIFGLPKINTSSLSDLKDLQKIYTI